MNRALTSIAGLLGVALNGVAVAALQATPAAYQPHTTDAWLQQARLHPSATQVSAIAFTLGLVALAVWAFGVTRQLDHRWARLGGRCFGGGALLNAAGTLAPLVALEVADGAARTLLQATLALDTAFNALLCLALACFAAVPTRPAWPRWLRFGAAVAAVLALPVAGQFWFLASAQWLVVAGPVWLSWVVASSVVLLRKSDG